jgi:hypothetical protein
MALQVRLQIDVFACTNSWVMQRSPERAQEAAPPKRESPGREKGEVEIGR